MTWCTTSTLYRNWQDVFFGEVLDFNGEVHGMVFYLMLPFFAANGECVLNVFCEMQQEVRGGRQHGGFKRRERSR